MLGTLIVQPAYWIGNTKLTLTVGFEAMGFFAVAWFIFQALTIIPNSIVIPLLPKIAELSIGLSKTIEALMTRSIRSASILFFPLFFGIALFSESIIEFLYGSSYLEAGKVVFLMVIAGYFFTISSLVITMIYGIGRTRISLELYILWAILFLFLAIYTIPFFKLEGLGVSFIGSYGCLFFASLLISWKIFNINLKSTYFILSLPVIFLISCYFIVTESDFSGF